MARISLKHRPELTKEILKTALEAHFEPKGYEVGYSSLIGADIYIKKTAWVGVTIKLRQTKDSTFLRIHGYSPSMWARLFLGGLIMVLILNSKWNALIKEVKEFLNTEN